MKRLFVIILLSIPTVLFAQRADSAALRGAFIVYAYDSLTKKPLDSVHVQFYDENKELVTQGYTKITGYDTITVPFGNYKITIDHKRYHLRTRYVNFEPNPRYRKNYFALICPLAKSGIRLDLNDSEK